jgi:hypothetical protein
MAGVLGIDYDTLSSACKRDHKVKFSDWIKKKSMSGKMSLRRKQYTTAMDGNPTMLVWLGKNWLGQSDNKEIMQVNLSTRESELAGMSDEELSNEIKLVENRLK